MKKQLSSGATIEVSVADIRTGYALFCDVIRAFKAYGLDLSVPEKWSFQEIIRTNTSQFVNGFLDVVTSQSVLDQVLVCGERSIYTKKGVAQKVTLDVFENEENREDFFEVMYTIAQENLRPFLPKALTK